MTVRTNFATLLAFAGLLLGAGCGGGDRTPFSSEVDESSYREGQQFKNQGHNNEALSAFLHVIENRGERGAPESHLEAGLIYAQHIKDPLTAIYHFRKYLELQPNSPNANLVRGRIESATRDFVSRLPGRLLDTDTARMELQDRVDRLERENAALKAELDSLHVTTPAAFVRIARAPAEAGARDPGMPPPPPALSSSPAFNPTISPAPMPPGPAPFVFQAPSRSAAATTKSAAPPPLTAKKHTVVAGDTLFQISVKYFHNGSKVDAIFEANRDVMKTKGDLKPGMELKLP